MLCCAGLLRRKTLSILCLRLVVQEHVVRAATEPEDIRVLQAVERALCAAADVAYVARELAGVRCVVAHRAVAQLGVAAREVDRRARPQPA